MENLELNCNADEEIVDAIKNILLKLYPILENRIDMLFDEDRCIDIVLNFVKNVNQSNREYTHIYFMDGTSSSKSNTKNFIDVDGLANQETIYSLIQFILNDHDSILNIQKDANEILIEFYVGMCDENMQGMGCYKIGLKLQFRNYPNHGELLNQYFISIFRKFHKELKNTRFFQEQWDEYCKEKKTEIINSMTHEDLEYMKMLLTDKDLCQILFSMSHNRFIELYNKFEDKKGNTRELIKTEEM